MPPAPDPSRPDRIPSAPDADAALRALARLLARQAVRDMMTEAQAAPTKETVDEPTSQDRAHAAADRRHRR